MPTPFRFPEHDPLPDRVHLLKGRVATRTVALTCVCGERLKAFEADAGKKYRCTSCQRTGRIPEPAMLDIFCERCGVISKFPEADAGRWRKCSGCAGPLLLPFEHEELPEPKPAARQLMPHRDDRDEDDGTTGIDLDFFTKRREARRAKPERYQFGAIEWMAFHGVLALAIFFPVWTIADAVTGDANLAPAVAMLLAAAPVMVHVLWAVLMALRTLSATAWIVLVGLGILAPLVVAIVWLIATAA